MCHSEDRENREWGNWRIQRQMSLRSQLRTPAFLLVSYIEFSHHMKREEGIVQLANTFCIVCVSTRCGINK